MHRTHYSPRVTQAELNWEDLRFFLRAAQANTLAGTARAMGVEHTTIGRRLTALEKQLGVALFVRGPRGLSLTQLGKRLLPLVQEVECGVHAVQELAVTQRERVRVSMPPGIAGLLMPHLGKLQREHPDVTIETVSSGRSMGLKRGEVDLAIRLLPVSDESLIVRQLPDMAWSLYAAPSYLKVRHAPQDIDDLSGHEIIAYGSDVAAQPAARWMEARSNNARVILRANEIDTAVTAAVDGAGLAILPCFFADRESRLRRLTPEILATRSMWLVYRSDARLSKPIKIAVKFVLDSMRANATRLAGLAAPAAR
jgi:DNA-binding transcriptional LysR family regulator